MDKWFNENLERGNLRKHTLKHLKGRGDGFGNYIDNFSRKFSVTVWLIIVNVLVYLSIVLTRAFGIFSEEQIFYIFALSADSFFSGAFWTLLTSMFSHIWLPHLFFNLISLFFVGSFLERIIGRKKFFWFYIFSGLFAGFFYAVLSFYFGGSELGARLFVSPNVFAVGASGAIFGIAGLLAILTPNMRVYLILGPIVAIVMQAVLSAIFPEASFLGLLNLIITFYIFFSIFAMFSFNPRLRKLSLPMGMPFWLLPLVAIVPLVIIGLFVELPIGNTAHLGGLIAGLVYGQYLKKRYKRKTAMVRRVFGS